MLFLVIALVLEGVSEMELELENELQTAINMQKPNAGDTLQKINDIFVFEWPSIIWFSELLLL